MRARREVSPGAARRARTPGERGQSDYLYVAYAQFSDGRGFSLTPTSSLKYRAELHSATPIESPSFSDFAGCRWVKYLGDDSTVYGEVMVSDSDTTVSNVERIVFENAHVRRGIDGEVELTPMLKDIWISNKTVAQITQTADEGNIVAGYGACFPWGASWDCRFHGTDGIVLGDGTIVN